MKKIRIILIVIANSMAITCNSGVDCPVDKIVEIKLSEQNKAYFPYYGNDSIKCINSQKDTILIIGNLIDTNTNKEGFGNTGDCGEEGFYKLEEFEQIFYSNNIEYLSVSITTNKFSDIKIDVFLYGVQDYEIGYRIDQSLDTMTIDGIQYNDILIGCYGIPSCLDGFEMYYSKKKGLIKLVRNFKTVFQKL